MSFIKSLIAVNCRDGSLCSSLIFQASVKQTNGPINSEWKESAIERLSISRSTQTNIRTHAMALEDSILSSRPDSLSLPVEDKGEGEEVEVATEATVPTGVFNVSEELGHVVTTDSAPSPPPPAKVNRSFQAKLAEREATANQHRKKTQGTEKERGRFGWGE